MRSNHGSLQIQRRLLLRPSPQCLYQQCRTSISIPSAPSAPMKLKEDYVDLQSLYKLGVGSSIPAPPAHNKYFNTDTKIVPPPDIDFCFHVHLDEIPPPPTTNFIAKKEAIIDAFQEQSVQTFSVQNFVSTIPSFFVPVEEVLKYLEGYTMDHINMYFGRTRSVQLVPLGGKQFIRIFGGYSKLDMSETYDAARNFPQYSINPVLAEPYIAAFKGIRNTWMPLRLLIEKGGPAAEAALPFQGPQSLLYFAQMQHIFAFAPDNGGAVQLRDPNWCGLDLDSSPCPAAAAFLLDSLVEDQVDLSQAISGIRDDHKADMLKFFPSVEACIQKHAKVFYMDKQANILMRTRTKQRLDQKNLPLEQQLELALMARDKKKVRHIRRKIQVRNNPNNPLLERDTLAREVFNYIPKKGYITMSMLARRTLPVEMLDFMGQDHVKFFKLYPQYFQIFELHEATKWCISRAGVELPQGVLRTEYTEEEIVRIVASVIQKRGAMPGVRLTLYVPDGVRDWIKKTYTSFYYFALKYPQYFSLMKRSETASANDSAVISLLKMPVEGAASPSSFTGGGAHRKEGQQQPDDDDDFLD